MPNKDMGLKKKNQMKNSYMGGGNTMMPKDTMMPKAPMSAMYRKGGQLYMGGGQTMAMDKTMSNKDSVQKRFGGGGMTGPSMKKNK